MPTGDDSSRLARICRIQARLTTHLPTAEELRKLAERFEREAKAKAKASG